MNNDIRMCPKCGTRSELFYFPNCGEIFDYLSFVGNSEKRKRSLQEFIKKVITVAKQQKIDVSSAIDGSPIRNAIYRKYYERIAYLQKLCSNKTTQSYFMNSGSNMFDQMNQFAEKCELGECQIAVVGTVKAGKSAFINALIGKEIASSYPTPETASVTKFRKSEKGDYVKVSFYTSEEWQQLWDSVHNSTADAIKGDENENFLHLYESLHAEEIRTTFLNKQTVIHPVKSLDELKSLIDRFTSARFPEHFFAKEVEVGLNDFFAPSNVVIVDTPGLDDPVPYRTDITRRYLPKANVVLLCIRSNRPVISSTEKRQFSYIFQALRYHKERIITIGTQIDDTGDDKVDLPMLEYWDKITLPEYLKYMSSSTLYGSKETAGKHIFPVSALYYFYIQNAIKNPQIFLGKNEQDKKLRKKIDAIIRRYYDCPEREDLIDEYGEDEGNKLYRTPRQLYEEHKYDLLNMTQVIQIRKMILDGPIQNANAIILNDIKDMYIRLSKEIHEISSEIISHRQETITLSKSSDILHQIEELEKAIPEFKKLQREQSSRLSQLLASIEKASRKEIDKIKQQTK